MNSHIQMPKCILKNFENEHHFLYYYDIEIPNKQIKKGHAKTVNTAEDYYSDYIEKYLDRNIESPLGVIAKFVKDISLDNTYVLPNGFKETMYRYILSLFSRGKRMQEEFNNHSVFFQFFSESDKHNIPIIYAQNENIVNNLISQYEYTFAINTTDISFVLPTYGLISFEIFDDKIILIPMSPKRAVCLVHKSGVEKHIKNETMKFLKFDNADHIKQINVFAYKQLKKYKYGCLISYDKKELERIIFE